MSQPPPLKPSAPSGADFRSQAEAAAKDALTALRTFVANPVGDLGKAFEGLGPRRGLSAGIVFGAGASVCFVLGLLLASRQMMGSVSFAQVIKMLVFGVVPFVSLAGAIVLAGKLFGSSSSLGGDVFVAGASILPSGLFVLLSGILGRGNLDLVAALFVFALSYTVLILFSGCTKISGISERRGALAVPLIVIVSALLSRALFNALL